MYKVISTRLRAETLLRTHSCDRPGAAAVRGTPMNNDITCPACGYDDSVQSVPAIRASGTSTVYDTGYFGGVGVSSAGLVPVIGSSSAQRTHTTQLARALAPEPEFRGAGRLTVIGLITALPAAIYLLLGGIRLIVPHPEASTASIVVGSLILAAFLGSPSLLILWFAFRRAYRTSRIRRGAPRAYAVWQAGIFCHRCGICFWSFPPAPGIPVRHPVLPGNFQRIVWNAGNYVHLA